MDHQIVEYQKIAGMIVSCHPRVWHLFQRYSHLLSAPENVGADVVRFDVLQKAFLMNSGRDRHAPHLLSDGNEWNAERAKTLIEANEKVILMGRAHVLRIVRQGETYSRTFKYEHLFAKDLSENLNV